MSEDAVDVFDAAIEAFDVYTGVGQFVAQQVDDAVDVALAIHALAFEFAGDFLVDIGFEGAQGTVFEFAFELGDTEAVRQRGEQVAGLQGKALLLLRAVSAEVAHEDNLQRQFEDDGTHVAGHGEKHFAQTLDVALFLFVQLVDKGEVVKGLQKADDAVARASGKGFQVELFFAPRFDEETGGKHGGVAAQVEQEFDEGAAALVRWGGCGRRDGVGGADLFAGGVISVVFFGFPQPCGLLGGIHVSPRCRRSRTSRTSMLMFSTAVRASSSVFTSALRTLSMRLTIA